MPTPFDHLEDFKTLPPRIQKKVVDKFNTLDPEQKQTVMGKINTPMQMRGLEPGITPVEPVSDLAVKGLESYKQNAPILTEALAESGVNPKLAKVVGKTFEHIPDIAGLAATGPRVAKAVPEIAKAAAESTIGKAIWNTGANEVARLTEKVAELPVKQIAKKELAETSLQEAGSEIGKAEKILGIDKSNTSAWLRRSAVKTAEAATKFADRAGKLADKGADRLAELGNPNILQFYRKTASDALSKYGNSLAKETKTKLYQIQKTFGEAIGTTTEGSKTAFKESVSRYSEMAKLISKLPKESIKEKRLLELALAKAKNIQAKQSGIRKAIGYTGGAAVGLGVAKMLKDTITGK